MKLLVKNTISVLTIGPGFNDSHLIDARRQGAIRSYPLEFSQESKINTLRSQIKRHSLKMQIG